MKFSAKMSTHGRVHKRIMFRCWFLYLPLCLLWQPHLSHPCFWPFPLWGLVCFIEGSKNERVCYDLCGVFCWVGYSQIAGDLNYQLMLGDQLMPSFTLGSLHDLCTFRYGLNTRWTYPFFYLLPTVSGFCIAISICDCLLQSR